MPKIKIELTVAIEGLVLVVYYSPRHYYQFSIVDEFNMVHEFDDIFASPDKTVEVENS